MHVQFEPIRCDFLHVKTAYHPCLHSPAQSTRTATKFGNMVDHFLKFFATCQKPAAKVRHIVINKGQNAHIAIEQETRNENQHTLYQIRDQNRSRRKCCYALDTWRKPRGLCSQAQSRHRNTQSSVKPSAQHNQTGTFYLNGFPLAIRWVGQHLAF